MMSSPQPENQPGKQGLSCQAVFDSMLSIMTSSSQPENQTGKQGLSCQAVYDIIKITLKIRKQPGEQGLSRQAAFDVVKTDSNRLPETIALAKAMHINCAVQFVLAHRQVCARTTQQPDAGRGAKREASEKQNRNPKGKQNREKPRKPSGKRAIPSKLRRLERDM